MNVEANIIVGSGRGAPKFNPDAASQTGAHRRGYGVVGDSGIHRPLSFRAAEFDSVGVGAANVVAIDFDRQRLDIARAEGLAHAGTDAKRSTKVWLVISDDSIAIDSGGTGRVAEDRE